MNEKKPVCLFRNRSLGLIQYDPFDPRLPNFNALITGSSGTGKSFVSNLVLLQLLTQATRQAPIVYLIDIGGSYRKLCEVFKGKYVEISPPEEKGAESVINPFVLPRGVASPTPRKIKFLLSFLENLFTEGDDKKLTRIERSYLEEGVMRLYQESEGTEPTLSKLSTLLSSSPYQSLRDFSTMLYPWTGDRAYGQLLDGKNTLDISSSLVVFDLKGLSSYPDLQSVMILIITDFILGCIDKNPGRLKCIYMDECWELLKSRASQHFMEYCVRTLRKTGSGITFITQGLEEILASPIGPAILSNTATKIVLPQRGDLERIRNTLKLNAQQTSLVSSLHQLKGHYSEAFLIANEDRCVIRIEPSPLEYWIATSDPADNRILSIRRTENPDLTFERILSRVAKELPQGAVG